MKSQIEQLTWPEDVKIKAYIFVDCVMKCFHYLESIGYKLQGCKFAESEVFPYTIKCVYYGRSARRDITISYTPLGYYKEPMNSVSISITKDPYRDQYDFLSFRKYLKKYRPDIKPDELEINLRSGEFEERVDFVIKRYAELLKDICMDIVSGNSWEEGFFEYW